MSAIEIKKLLIVETGTYNDAVLRPFKSHLDPGTVSMFQEATQDGTNINSKAISGVAGALLKPAANFNALVPIANGWDTRRLRFMMEVVTKTGFGFDTREIITGYTDHAGISLSGAVDPNMAMFINNSITLRTTTDMNITTTTVTDASHVIAPPMGNSAPGYSSNATSFQSMRPSDVVAAMSLNTIDTSGEVFDFRTGFIDGVKKSKRTNTLAPEYLARTLNGLKTAFNDPTRMATSSAAEVYGQARSITMDGLVSQDKFLQELTQKTEYGQTGYVTFGTLKRLFPYIEDITVFSPATQLTRQGIPLSQRGGSEYWSVTTSEAVIATILMQAVPAIMMECMTTKCIIIATNETVDGEPFIDIRNPMSFTDGVDLRPFMQHLDSRLRYEVLRDISNANQINYRLQMLVDVLGETRITISFASQPEVEFVAPSFCDALMVPVITNNQFDLRVLATDIDNLYNNIAPSSFNNHYAPPNYMAAPQQQPLALAGSPYPAATQPESPYNSPYPPIVRG